MISKVNFKTFAIKAVLIAVCVAMVIGIAPLAELVGFVQSASALSLPEYDSSMGTVTEADGVLTAAPAENYGFRGWYDKSTGLEVSTDLSFTLPDGKSKDDYVPAFYNFNLISNGGFEDYAVGTNLKTTYEGKDIWDGCTDGSVAEGEASDWTTVTVTDQRARSGNNSAKILSRNNSVFRTVSDLEMNTQYRIEFYYNLDASVTDSSSGTTATPYMQYITVVPRGSIATPRGNRAVKNLVDSYFTSTDGACAEGEWKKVSLTFFTGDTTDIELCILYTCDVNAYIYIDDISIVKAEMAAPTYANEDFSSGYAPNWSVSNEDYLSFSATGGKLLTNEPRGNYAFLYSSPIFLKKGYDYTIDFKLDLSGVTDESVQAFDTKTGEYIVDENGDPVWEVHNQETGGLSANWINFSLSNKENNYGNGTTLFIPDDGTDDVKLTVNVTNDSSTHGGYTKTNTVSSIGFGKSGVKSGSKYEVSRTLDCNNFLHSLGSLWGGGHNDSCYNITYANDVDPEQVLNIKLSFTAPATGLAYFNSRLNGRGTYSIDDFTVTESGSGIVEEVIKQNLKTVGTAIRTNGVQGLRYKTSIDKRLLTNDKYLGFRVIEYGTVAIRSEYLDGKELLLDTTYTYNNKSFTSQKGVAYSFENSKDVRYAENGSTIHYTGVLMNIAEKFYNSGYTIRSYIKYKDNNGAVQIIYTDPTDTTVYTVSKYAYYARSEGGNFTEAEEVRRYLYKNILSKFTDKVVTVNNASAPIYSGFQGIRSTIYHATTFFPDSHGRTYTDEQAATEMDRLVDSKVDNVRTRFASQWMWKEGVGWDWESTKMTAFYKWAKMLQDRDISVTLQAGWHLHDFIYYYDTFIDETPVGYSDASSSGHSSISEVNYLHGYTNDSTAKAANFYGEDSNASAIEAAGRAVGLGLDDSEFAHYSVAAARYAEWIKQGLNAFKAHGVYNIEYVLPFTETGYAQSGDETYSYDEWTLMTMALHDALKTEGTRNDYKFIGPAQSIYAYQNRLSFVEYLYSKIKGTDYENMLDINAMHQYTRPNTSLGYEDTVYEPFASHSMAQENFSYYNDVLVSSGVRDMEFWCDEYFAHAGDAKWWHNVGMQMTQFAAGLTAGINNGVNRFLTWQMFDTLWDSDATHGFADQPTGSGEFIGGVHAVGTCPSLIKVDGKTCSKGEYCECNRYSYSSYVPRVTYYGINLIGRYMNNENADVFSTSVVGDADQDDGGIYVSAINNDKGQLVILVVNTKETMTSVDVQLEKKVSDTYKRYTYDPVAITPTEDASPILSDKSITASNNGTCIKDVIPPRSFAIYVSSEIIIGDDVDMEM